MRIHLLFAVCLVLAGLAHIFHAHGGGRGGEGCRDDRRHGGQRCHRSGRDARATPQLRDSASRHNEANSDRDDRVSAPGN